MKKLSTMNLYTAVLIVATALLTACGQGAGSSSEKAAPASSPAASSSQPSSTTSPSCADSTPHQVSFVTVAPGVDLEVLDFGGNGDAMVLLTGGGDNAHIYDQFAYQFTDRFHVVGITRRGYGRSSQPADGYDLETRARDDIAVLDKLNIPSAVFVGHSIAGTELNKLGSAHANRVKKLVYLDSLDNGSGNWTAIPQPAVPAENTPEELSSISRLAAASVLTDGYRGPLPALCNMVRMDASGRVTGAITSAEVGAKINTGLRPAEYDKIQAPVLAIINSITPQYRLPYFDDLDAAKQKQSEDSIKQLSVWVAGAIQRLRSGVKNVRVVEVKDANHYVYIVQEGLVVREMRKFLAEK